MVTKLCLRRARAVCIAAYGPGEEDLGKLRPILAELGMWAINTTDFCGMGIKDPEGKIWYAYDWGSNEYGVRGCPNTDPTTG
jgi:hypothetical protein